MLSRRIDRELKAGDLAVRDGDYARGLSHYQKYADIDTSGRCLTNASLAAFKLGEIEASIEFAKRAIRQNPSIVEAYVNLSAALATAKKLHEAVDVCDSGLKLDQNNVQLWSNRGGAQTQLGFYEEGSASLSKALELNPQHVFSLLNNGNALRSLLRLEDAEQCYLRAHSLDRTSSDALWNLAILYLLKGEFEKGLPLYEARWSTSHQASDRFHSPKPWVDSSRYYNSILIWPEQGVGDEIMFASHFGFLHLLSRRVSIIADERLIPMFRRSFPVFDFLPRVGYINHNDYEAHLPIGSLPLLRFQMGISQSWFGKPYLIPPANSKGIEDIKRCIPQGKRLVGISWRSHNDKTQTDRTIPLIELLKTLDPSADFAINLQYGESAEEFEASCKALDLSHHSTAEIDKFNDWEGLSTLVAACDQVVSVDNSTAHLAGSLGVSSFILLPLCPDWRWGLESTFSQWYESVQLVRQDTSRNWDHALNELNAALARKRGPKPPSPDRT